MDVERRSERVNASSILRALLSEFSAINDHRTLRDSLPRRLAKLLRCRCVLFYQRLGETLQFASGSYDDKPGWSASLLAVAHINPIDVNSDVPEACAWREQRVVVAPERCPTLAAAPLIYRRRGIGVLAAVRVQHGEKAQSADYWTEDEVPILEAIAGIVALLLENARLLERDRERIHELSLLNSISSQVNYALYDQERLRSLLIQRTKEIAGVDRYALIDPASLDPTSWVTPALRSMLLQRFSRQRAPAPLLIERIGEAGMPQIDDYLRQLPADVKTFFAIPLLSGRSPGRRHSSQQEESIQERRVLGIIAGAYHRAHKVRREQLVLLQVLASQCGVALENMRLIEEKRRLDRLAALGEMAANVAHEVRNPLASIKTSMQMLMDELRDEGVGQQGDAGEGDEQSEWVQESIGVVLKEVERLDAIVRDLLLFARPRQLHRAPCNLVDLCERVLQLIQAQCVAANVCIRRSYEEVPLLHVDAAQIEQVLLNLYMNALQAMPDGGTLTVACRVLTSAALDNGGGKEMVAGGADAGESTPVDTAEGRAGLSAQQWVEIAVGDTGSGIPPDRLERIFQPFFTTKAHGIGLGLAITRRLVEDHGGYIRAGGQVGSGARISVYLPLRSEDTLYTDG
jgi:signal transduction histidine kinase